MIIYTNDTESVIQNFIRNFRTRDTDFWNSLDWGLRQYWDFVFHLLDEHTVPYEKELESFKDKFEDAYTDDDEDMCEDAIACAQEVIRKDPWALDFMCKKLDEYLHLDENIPTMYVRASTLEKGDKDLIRQGFFDSMVSNPYEARMTEFLEIIPGGKETVYRIVEVKSVADMLRLSGCKATDKVLVKTEESEEFITMNMVDENGKESHAFFIPLKWLKSFDRIAMSM